MLQRELRSKRKREYITLINGTYNSANPGLYYIQMQHYYTECIAYPAHLTPHIFIGGYLFLWGNILYMYE